MSFPELALSRFISNSNQRQIPDLDLNRNQDVVDVPGGNGNRFCGGHAGPLQITKRHANDFVVNEPGFFSGMHNESNRVGEFAHEITDGPEVASIYPLTAALNLVARTCST
ncbi:MAG TPA: hypothetical protein PKE55_07640 [Kiritimatiellia bacterium]|nr:hypothetical protein [Kiritimatiellia bacterium]